MALNFLDRLLDPNFGGLFPRKNVQVVDTVSTSLPSNFRSLEIDGSTLSFTSRVLYTALSNPDQNNRIYVVVTKSHGVMNLQLTTDGKNADGSPVEGELVYVDSGVTQEGSLWGFDSINYERIDFNNLAPSTISGSDVLSSLGYTPLNKAGDTMGGPLNMGGKKINNIQDPASAQDAATKNYVDTHSGGGTAVTAVTIQDIRASGTNGGDGTAATWVQRTLNTLNNPSSVSWVSLTSNQFTLSAGTYLIEGFVVNGDDEPSSGPFATRLQNITGTSTVTYASSSTANNGNQSYNLERHFNAIIVVSSSTTYEIDTEVTAAGGSNIDFGAPAGIAGVPELYASLSIMKLQ